jgi:hypothetical protein
MVGHSCNPARRRILTSRGAKVKRESVSKQQTTTNVLIPGEGLQLNERPTIQD